MELSESRTNKVVLPDAEKTVRIQVQIYKKTETFMGIIVFIFSLHPEDIFFRRIPRIKTVRRTGKISDMNYSAKRGRERKTGFRTLPLTDSAWGKRIFTFFIGKMLHPHQIDDNLGNDFRLVATGRIRKQKDGFLHSFMYQFSTLRKFFQGTIKPFIEGPVAFMYRLVIQHKGLECAQQVVSL